MAQATLLYRILATCRGREFNTIDELAAEIPEADYGTIEDTANQAIDCGLLRGRINRQRLQDGSIVTVTRSADRKRIMQVVYVLCASVLLVSCTSILVTETNDKKGNTVAVVKISATATGDVKTFLAEARAEIQFVCSPPEMAVPAPPPAVVDVQALLGLIKTARELLPTHEYVKTCLLQPAQQNPMTWKNQRHK